jgi:hypothetical protein
LLLQAIMVQMICIMYEFVLLKMCNLQHMKRFSVFLALPSATIRSMTARPCVVRPCQHQRSSSAAHPMTLSMATSGMDCHWDF